MFKNTYSKIFKTAGFTLIELAIVMAVLSILAAVAVPRLSGFRTTAANKVDEVNASILTGIAQKVQAETEKYPEWQKTFDNLDESLAGNVKIQNPANKFNYDSLTGTVIISRASDELDQGREKLEDIIKGLDITIFKFIPEATALNPVVMAPSSDDVSFIFTSVEGQDKGEGNPEIQIVNEGKAAKITRGNGNTTKTLILTLQIGRGTEAPANRKFYINVPGNHEPYESVEITTIN